MADILSTARSAREALAQGLNALQADPSAPSEYLQAAEPIAQAMGALHQIERSGGQMVTQAAPQALDAVRAALAVLQRYAVQDPRMEQVLETVASSLGQVFSLTKMTSLPPASPSANAPLDQTLATGQAPSGPQVPPLGPYQPPQPVSAPQPYGAPPGYSPPQPGPAPLPYGAPPQAPYAPPPAPPGVSPNWGESGVGRPPPWLETTTVAQTPQTSAPAPLWAEKVLQQAEKRAAAGDARPGAFPTSPVWADKAPAQPLASTAVSPSPMWSEQDPFAPPGANAAPAAPASPQAAMGMTMPSAQPNWPPAEAPQAPAAPQPYREQDNLPMVEAELGAHSASNFFKGLSGNDVVDNGGLFIATYQSPEVGRPVRVHVSLPGSLEFEAIGVVKWVRESRDSMTSEISPPGFGLQFTHISPEARQLVYRYVRNREPLFHDDL